MRYTIILGLLFITQTGSANHAHLYQPGTSPLTACPFADNNEEQETKKILTTFLAMLGNFAAIVANPKDHTNVGANITTLFANMMSIGMELFNKHMVLEEDEAAQIELILSEEDIQELRRELLDVIAQIQDRLKLNE